LSQQTPIYYSQNEMSVGDFDVAGKVVAITDGGSGTNADTYTASPLMSSRNPS
jgi:hypothetical protein